MGYHSQLRGTFAKKERASRSLVTLTCKVLKLTLEWKSFLRGKHLETAVYSGSLEGDIVAGHFSPSVLAVLEKKRGGGGCISATTIG